MQGQDANDKETMPDERAERIIQLQELICRLLGEQAIRRASQIPAVVLEDVRIHVITCPENHPRIEGLFFEDD